MATYTDIDLSFEKHPVTGDIPIKRDASAVKASLQNIILTNFYERGFNVSFGANVRGQLFELIDPITTHEIKNEIRVAVENFEPRAELKEVIVYSEGNKLTATISFYILNRDTPEELSIALERLN